MHFFSFVRERKLSGRVLPAENRARVIQDNDTHWTQVKKFLDFTPGKKKNLQEHDRNKYT